VYLVSECNTSHTILHAKDVIVDGVNAMHLVTTRRVGQRELGAIDTRKVQTTTRLGLVHGQTERPRVQRCGIERRVREVLGVHFVGDVVVERLRRVFEERGAVDVHTRFIELVHRIPRTSRGVSRNQVNRLGRVIEIGEINFGVGIGRQLILGLRDENLVFIVRDKLALVTVEVRVHTVDLRRLCRREPIATLHTNFHFVVLQTDEREALGPVFAEEEWNQIVIRSTIDTLGVILNFSRRDRGRGTSLIFFIDDIVHTLDVQRIEAGDFLATDVQEEFGRLRRTRGEQTVAVRRDVRDVLRFDPHVSEHVTLRANRDGDFVVGTERTDVVHALRLNRKIRVTPVVLTEETDLRFTRDVHILGTLRDKINQGC